MVAEVAENVEYQIRPSFEEHFKKDRVEEEIKIILGEVLEGKSYEAESALEVTENLTAQILDSVKEMGMSSRFKFIVDVKYGEVRGQGVNIAMRAIWDSDTDKKAVANFINDSVFCSAIVFGIYYN